MRVIYEKYRDFICRRLAPRCSALYVFAHLMTTRTPKVEPRTLAEALVLIEQRDAVIAERDFTIRELRAQLIKRFTGSSERLTALNNAQLLLFHDALKEDQKRSGAAAADSGITVKGHTRRANGRVRIPAHLPREHVVHDLTPEERSCPCCGKERIPIGSETSEVLEYVPATMKAIVHERRKYGCPECAGHFVTADLPKTPFDRSKAGPGLLAAIAVSKYADHLPLYRQEGIFKRFGVSIPRSTQCDWMRRVAEAIEPLAKRIATLVRASRIIQSDDTPVKLRDGPKKGMSESRFWSYVGDHAHPYVAYDFSPNRRGEHPRNWLAGCAGYLQSDAYAGYEALTRSDGELVAVGCWAHARRKFHDARIAHSGRSADMLALIQQLYAVEKKAREDADQRADDAQKSIDAAARHALRCEHAAAVVDAVFTTLRGWQPQEPPKGSLGQAITYALNQEVALRRYLDDGELEIDNNACERSLRGIALGRKNWLFAGSEQGGRTAATIFTVIGSARLHEIEPWAYLHDVLDRMPHAPTSQLDTFLPDQWAPAHPGNRLPLNR